jgi:pyrroline-5-carboxylate reductase
MAISKVAIVGAGVMGEAMINALIKIGVANSEIIVKEKRIDRVNELIEQYGVKNCSLESAQAVILAVKPQDFEKTLRDVSPELGEEVLLISLLAGVESSRIEDIVGEKVRVVRVMTNTPLLVGAGMSAISVGKSAKLEDVSWVDNLFSASGATLMINEELMDAVTATSGSGPAYFFEFVEAMIEGAIKLGLDEGDAKILTAQTLIGAAKMISDSGKDAKTLRENVTSPNGTTAAALSVFSSHNWYEIVYKAMTAAKKRAKTLNQQKLD